MHALGGEGETHGHRGEKPLGHVGHDDTDHEHEVGDPGRLHHDSEDEEHDTENYGDSGDDLNKSEREGTRTRATEGGAKSVLKRQSLE